MAKKLAAARVACVVLAALSLGAANPPAAPPTREAPRAASIHALLINGGGSPEDNFSSHLAHLRQMLALLARAGVPAEQIAVFNADGPDPAPDMAVREPEPEGYELLADTKLGESLVSDVGLESSSLPGVHARPATRASLERWFADERARLHAGDTLLLYVTDHGSQNARDPLDNRIVLWGRHESLSVRQLRALLDRLPAGVRVVALMSQCFSGGFARLASWDAGDRKGGTAEVARGETCGYYSSTADRPAYGCYPVVAGRERVGHSFEFMEALARTGSFPLAHAEVLATDDTPDVPLRSSDVFLSDVIARPGAPADAAIDSLLSEAWKDRARWEPEIRLLDRIGRAFGLASPRSLAEIASMRPRLESLQRQLEEHAQHWGDARQSAAEGLEHRFLLGHPEWVVRLAPVAVRALDEAGRRRLAVALATALRSDDSRAHRLETLVARTTAADEAAYRMEVRLGALLRMRAVLTSIAGRVYLATRGTPSQVAAYESLRRCEDLSLPALAPGATPAAEHAVGFPTLDDDQRVVREVLPSWMGIVFEDVPPRRRTRMALGEGAALVRTVLPGSPAEAAGLAVGDVVLGPPGHPFDERREIQVWTMLLPIGKAAPIEVERAGRRRTLTLMPSARPVDLPSGPPRPPMPAPAVEGTSYRGAAPGTLARGPFLLFFWATWCAPCKESLPEVLAFSRQWQVPVLAVTDEGRADLDAFFARFHQPFPDNVVSDDKRGSFASYAVSGTPTFVLVDAAHRVRSYSVGYRRQDGLPLPGWRWDGR